MSALEREGFGADCKGTGAAGGWTLDTGDDFSRFVAAVRTVLLFEGTRRMAYGRQFDRNAYVTVAGCWLRCSRFRLECVRSYVITHLGSLLDFSFLTSALNLLGILLGADDCG